MDMDELLWCFFSMLMFIITCTVMEVSTAKSPCLELSCGANSECLERNGRGYCTCLLGYVQHPYDGNTGCVKECIESSDCEPAFACINFKCINPCERTCRRPGTRCDILENNLVCSCKPGFSGDSTEGCSESSYEDICKPRHLNNCVKPAFYDTWTDHNCKCLDGYEGTHPHCGLPCSDSRDCPEGDECLNNICGDPCRSSCGFDKVCVTIDGEPICACPEGRSTNPFVKCITEYTKDGPNSLCTVSGGGSSACSSFYSSIPPSCNVSCKSIDECPLNYVCDGRNSKCIERCHETCGKDNMCFSKYGSTCLCPDHFAQNQGEGCILQSLSSEVSKTNPCIPYRCGPNSKCEVVWGLAVCSCLQGYIGAPPNCRHLCRGNLSCPHDKICSANGECIDPCLGACGIGANCITRSHVPICNCPPGYYGDPFIKCTSRNLCPQLKSSNVEINCVYKGTKVPCTAPMAPETEAHLICKQGFVLSQDPGYNKLTCQYNGNWDRPLFTCYQDCGSNKLAVRPQISHGVEVQPGEIPWHVGIYRYRNGDFIQICAGSLVNSDTVVSAAHCFWSESLGKPIQKNQFRVAMGKIYRDWKEKEFYVEERQLEDIIIHEEYRGRPGLFRNDIAILKLKVPVQFTWTLLPVCISLVNTNTYEHFPLINGSLGVIAGWGITEKNEPSEILLTTKLPYIDFGTCWDTVPDTFRTYLTKDKFCAGYRNGTSVCSGDSGGGLMFLHRNNKYYLRGIVSLGVEPQDHRDCATDQYSTFTKVSDFIPWLMKYIPV